jgi:hypothetical protein
MNSQDFVAQVSKPAVSRVSKPATISHCVPPADLEVGDTAGLETCATLMPPTSGSGRTAS